MQIMHHMGFKPMRHLQLYRAIEAVVKEGSIRKGAELLAISPSALNRQLLALEAELGIPFFERLPQGVRLSTAGEIYYRQFIEHIAQIDRASAIVADLQGVRIGHVRLAVTRGLEAGIIAQCVKSFRRDFPRVSFSVHSQDASGFSHGLAADDFDLALIAQPLFQEAIETIEMVELPQVAIVSDAFLGKVLTPQDMEDFDLILPQGPSGLRARIDQDLKRLRLPVRPALEVDGPIPPWSGSGVARSSAQLTISPMLPGNWLTAHRARAVRVERFSAVQLALCKRAGRILPLAADKFAGVLVQALQPSDIS